MIMDYNAIIMEAKREWEQAYINGDQQGMEQAHAKAEQAREQARQANSFASIASYLQNGTDINSGLRYNEAAARLGGSYAPIQQAEISYPSPADIVKVPVPSEPQYDQYEPNQEYDADYIAILNEIGKQTSQAQKQVEESSPEQEALPQSSMNPTERKKPTGGIGDALMAIANAFFPSPDSLKRGR